MDESTCGYCRFYRPVVDYGKSGKGDCRRFPPSFIPGDGMVFPRVQKNEWCGEYADGAVASDGDKAIERERRI